MTKIEELLKKIEELEKELVALKGVSIWVAGNPPNNDSLIVAQWARGDVTYIEGGKASDFSGVDFWMPLPEVPKQ